MGGASGLGRRELLAIAAGLARPAKAQTKEQKMKPWPELELLKRSAGQHYIDLRDGLLRVPDLRSRIADAGPPDNWRDRIHLYILRGWLEHGELFRQVLAELDAVNVELEKKKITGFNGVLRIFAVKAERQWKEPVLPLIWEVLMKYRGAMPAWKQMVFVSMASAVPHAMSVEPLIEFMEHTPEPAAIDYAGTAMEALPPEAVKAGVEKHLAAMPVENKSKVREVLTRVLNRLPK